VYKFCKLRSCKPGDYEVTNLNFGNDMAKIDKFYQLSLILVSRLVGMIKLIFLWQLLKEHCYGNKLLLAGAIRRRRNWRRLLFALAFQNRLEYCNIHKWLYSVYDPCISCTNLVNFGPVTPKIMRWQIYNFWDDTVKIEISHHQISQKILTNLR